MKSRLGKHSLAIITRARNIRGPGITPQLPILPLPHANHASPPHSSAAVLRLLQVLAQVLASVTGPVMRNLGEMPPSSPGYHLNVCVCRAFGQITLLRFEQLSPHPLEKGSLPVCVLDWCAMAMLFLTQAFQVF